MRFLPVLACLILVAAFTSEAAVQFTTPPSLIKDGSNRLWVEFQMSESTDVAVSIVDPRDSSIVRHLAAGVLGSKAPLPLTSNSLSQRIEWDGKDDLGFAVTNPAAHAARVRAGMGVELKALVGDNPYAFPVVYGMVSGPDGSVYICGNPGSINQNHWSIPYKLIRAYDRDGNYLRTVYPYPSNLTTPQVQGWGVIEYPAGSYTPKYSASSIPGFTTTILSPINDNMGFGLLLFMDASGNLVYGTHSRAMTLGSDGSIPGTGVASALIKSPGLPTTCGQTFVTPLPGDRFALMSGFYAGGLSSGWPTGPVSTGEYLDGRVFKVDLTTGAASVWLDLDTIITNLTARTAQLLGGGYYGSIHGTAVDGQGRVYVCDRFNRRISVHDTSAALLGSIPLRAPDQVAVSKRTGAIYATVRIQTADRATTGSVRLFKFAPWSSGAAPLCSVTVQTSISNRIYPASLVLTETAAETRVWVGYNSVRIYRDDATQLTLIRNFGAVAGSPTQGFSRMTVDPRNETVYFNNDWNGFYKIEDWSNPAIVACSTSANKVLTATDMTLSPHGILYIREGGYYGPVTRYTTAHKHVPVNWTNTGSNMLTARINSRGEGAGYGERGLAVNPAGTVAVMGKGYLNISPWSYNTFHVSFYADSGSSATGFGDVKIGPIPEQCGGVKFDLKGNLYVGAKTASPGRAAPAAFASDWMYTNTVGTILRFPAGFDTGVILQNAASGTSKIYGVTNAPFTAENSGARCACRSPRFEVDPYGRIFAPNAITSEISIVDNEDNAILKFGRYGNADSRGGLAGPGQTISTPSIPLAYPVSVAATEDYIYVADFGNSRIARLKMNYTLDNLPGAAVERQPAANLGAELSAGPNPCHSSARVTVRLKTRGRVRLDLFTPDGRFIRTLASDVLNAGTHGFAWDGNDRYGRNVSAGTYFLRLQAGSKEFHQRIVVVR